MNEAETIFTLVGAVSIGAWVGFFIRAVVRAFKRYRDKIIVLKRDVSGLLTDLKYVEAELFRIRNRLKDLEDE